MRNDVSKYVLMKKVVVNITTAKVKMTIRYTHIWHKCIVMTTHKSGKYGDSSQLTNWVLDSGVMC